jgi:hypothetical protein
LQTTDGENLVKRMTARKRSSHWSAKGCGGAKQVRYVWLYDDAIGIPGGRGVNLYEAAIKMRGLAQFFVRTN